MPTRRSANTQPPPEAVASAAHQALAAVKGALHTVIASFPRPATGPSELARRLDIHQTLAWKILRIAGSHDLFLDVQYLPGVEGIEIFLAAAQAAGIDATLLAPVRAAVGEFQLLVETYAGDRASLEQMLSALSEDQRVQADSRPFRKAGFRCACSMLGAKAGVRVLSKVLHSSADGRTMDIALIRGFINMRRIRPGAPIPLARVVVLDNDGSARRESAAEPIDPSGVHAGVPLLGAFCSNPLPQIRIGMGPDGTPEHQLADAPVGERAATTVYSGEVRLAAASRFRDEHNLVSNTAVSIRLPIERLVIDVWVHRELGFETAPAALLFGELCGTPWYKQVARHADRLPLAERPVTLGSGLGRARLSDAPAYVDVMRFGFARLGWNPEEFLLHRLSVEYPMVGTALVMQLPLPMHQGPAAVDERAFI